ncbi:MAG TPA: transketolase C-terminal domain-containing protein [Aggregatilinea sp.]|uniref:transketolase family protein n=1 Tax=Aggregatilinea sp. TaxID=2806333 RepID=UPI002B5F73C7|nr:transketolase C-terminal domain-containing protein [Aggregatilinea sp.]HML20537.1 transketolase C-terminal domain-containing protein [Aggregatilinea sp.]
METGKANLEVMADTLMALAEHDRDLLVVTSDSRGSGKLVPFANAFPDQVVEVGIAEQNLVGIAAGLASTGKKVFAVSPACFLTARSLEQIKNDVAYSDQPVTVVGISAGVSYGSLGTTHHSLHDYAVMRTINNIDVLAPADNFETAEAIKAAYTLRRPVYVRFGKQAMPHLYGPGATFEVGKANVLSQGADVTFVATGETVPRAVQAAAVLEGEGLSCGVISVHTLKPFDAEAVLDAAENTRALITVEEHSIFGGLGEACASALMQSGVRVPFKIVGLPDDHTVTGSQNEIFTHYGISADGLANTARQLLQVGITA